MIDNEARNELEAIMKCTQDVSQGIENSNITSKKLGAIESKEKINRKHKVFVSRFEPPLYSPPSPP